MAEAVEWASSDSDDEEALSFSNLPVAADPDKEGQEEGGSSPAKDEQFEFRILGCAGGFPAKNQTDMCAAEDVFFHGQLRPLGQAHPVSRSNSTASLSLDGSSCVSRSLSSNSCASSSDAPPPRRMRSSSALYACPSPSPRITSTRRNGGVGSRRRSTGSAPPAGWGLLRLGVAMAPEMELQDIRVRRAGPKFARGGGMMDKEKTGGVVRKLLGGGLMGCRSSPEAAVAEAGKKEGGGRGRVAGWVERRERMVEWLKELSPEKEPLIG